MVNFDSAIDFEETQDLSSCRVADLVNGLASFSLRVDNAELMVEKRGQITAGYVAILVDCCGENSTTVDAIPRGVVSPAAKEGNSKGSPRYDHRSSPAKEVASCLNSSDNMVAASVYDSGVPISRKGPLPTAE